MARMIHTITVEGEMLRDAIDDLVRAHAALARRHGSAFRDLERRIEAIAECGTALLELHKVGGRLVAAPSGELTAVLVEARRLGVLS
ncbi:MAG: hypothetical protein CMN87_12185 [Stappia sp.]|uniref:hypothetical protein n=1 Tax=Stappia sp. TaxID=1870903 RepID=UPI000C463C87|nr:hypothetical protein [Stappia sp.]MAB00121.1 hypothetical protein [Stappia sp.]MBM20760.1 hypothetical protein [Stappia sp.]|tara:strand:+ start:337 stop:597 length:261 start_codon:yes stop_codon:yes gene_type:complete